MVLSDTAACSNFCPSLANGECCIGLVGDTITVGCLKCGTCPLWPFFKEFVFQGLLVGGFWLEQQREGCCLY